MGAIDEAGCLLAPFPIALLQEKWKGRGHLTSLARTHTHLHQLNLQNCFGRLTLLALHARTHARQSVRASRIPAVPTPPVPLPTLLLSFALCTMVALQLLPTDCHRDVPLRLLCISRLLPRPSVQVLGTITVLDGESIFPCRPAQPRTDTKLGFFGLAHWCNELTGLADDVR